MKASDIISKKVYAIEEGNETGYVLNFSLDEKNAKLKFLVVATLFEENEMILKVQDIVAISDEAVFVTSEKQLSFDANAFANNPIGKKVFSVSGDYLGKVVEVELQKDVTKKIITQSCEILPKYIYSSGRDCLFFSKNKKKIKTKKNGEIDTKVTIQNVAVPYKQKFQGEELIGKVIVKDILDDNHFLIFKKNTVISPKILIKAKEKRLFKALLDNSK